jgi:glycopeptide antibiotics resistance protein
MSDFLFGLILGVPFGFFLGMCFVAWVRSED